MVAAWTFWLYAFGPSLTLLRDELEFSYLLLGVYAAVLSAGAALSGAIYPRAARRFNRSPLLWGSALLAAAGAGLFAAGSDVALTMVGAALLGLAGTTLLTVTQAILSDQHGARRDRALTEANVGAAGSAVVAPLALGALAASPVGWGAAFVVPLLALAVLYLRYRDVQLAAPRRPDAEHSSGRLSTACWLFIGLVAVGMAVEFCMIYFGAEQLRTTGLSAAVAATALSSYYLGILLGRIGGAIATRRPGRSVALLHGSIVATGLGFLLFWLTPASPVAVAGLFLAGVGTANLYPLSVALALAEAPGREDQANARTQLLGGLLVTVAPFLLGGLAERLGLKAAFALEGGLICLCAVLLVAGLRLRPSVAPDPDPADG